jgi:hypothetical protein
MEYIMKSTSLPDGFPIRTNLIGKNLTKLLNDYLRVQIYNVPSSERSNLLNDPHITTRSFLISYWEKHLNNPVKKASFSLKGFEQDKYLYGTLITLVNAVQSKLLTEENFDLRCKLLCGVISLKEENIKEYYKRDIARYNLFSNLFDIIYKKPKLSKLERKLLDFHLIGALPEITKESKKIEEDINQLIRKFKMFAHFNSYRSTHKLYGKTIKLTQKYFDYIREIENNDQMSDFFIAKVFSIIYNYNAVIIESKGKYHFWLILQGTEDTISETRDFQYWKRVLETEEETSENKHIIEYCRNRVENEPVIKPNDEYEEGKDIETFEEPDEEWTPGYKSKETVELSIFDRMKDELWDDTDYLLEEFDNSGEEEEDQEPEEEDGDPEEEEKVTRRNKTRDTIYSLYLRYMKDPDNPDDNDDGDGPNFLTDLEGRNN